MKYMGSKNRIKKHIVPFIQDAIDESYKKTYLEPFAGGMNVIDSVNADIRVASDYNKYLIALFSHLSKGGELLGSVDRDFYLKVKSSYKSGSDEYPEWLVGNVGFLASYNGKWFDGGYAKSGYEKTKSGERYRDYYQESKRNIEKQMPKLQGVTFCNKDYREFKDVSGMVIYCDPPYKGVTTYENSMRFDHDEFWEMARHWSKRNKVFISEESAPSDFEVIWEKEVSRSMNAKSKSRSTEKLFTVQGA